MSDLALLDLSEAAAAIADGRLSSVEATRACLDRIEAWQPAVNAFIAVDHEGALAQAAARDGELARGHRRGPLHGVPLAHKDLLLRAGRVTTAGSKILRDEVAETTSTLLDRLDAAGAVELGTLHLAEFAAGPTGHNVHYGPCRNPYDRDYVTGGSSSGSGASVAARLAFGAIGSDTGGSIRLPAAACGITGLKATYGRVTRHGAVARSWSLDHIGPMARTARDCALLLQVIAGHDPRDASTSPRPVPDYMAALAQTSLAGCRVGVPESAIRDAHPDVSAAMDATIRTLEGLGAGVRPVRLPEMRVLLLAAETIIKSEAAALHRRWIAARPQDYASQVRLRIEAGFAIPATQYIDALRLRERFARTFLDESMAGIDVLLLPVMPLPTPTIADTDVEGASGEEVMANVGRMTILTRPFNLLGVPAMSLPAGFCARGLPMGLQLVAHPFAEAELLRIAHAFQCATEFHRAVPSLEASRGRP